MFVKYLTYLSFGIKKFFSCFMPPNKWLEYVYAQTNLGFAAYIPHNPLLPFLRKKTSILFLELPLSVNGV